MMSDAVARVRVARAKTASETHTLLNQIMSEWNTGQLVDWDQRCLWHPFTNMREWCAAEHEPLILVEGEARYCATAEAANTSVAIHPSGQTSMAITIPTH